MIFIAIWVGCGVLAGVIAASKGHSGCGWFLLGLVFGVFALLFALVLPRIDDRPVQVTVNAPAPPEPPKDRRKQKQCPDCAETILADARVCKHCGYRFDGTGNTRQIEAAPLRIAAPAFDPPEYLNATGTILANLLRNGDEPYHADARRHVIREMVRSAHGGTILANDLAAAGRWFDALPDDIAGLRRALKRSQAFSADQGQELVRIATDALELSGGGSERQLSFVEKLHEILPR